MLNIASMAAASKGSPDALGSTPVAGAGCDVGPGIVPNEFGNHEGPLCTSCGEPMAELAPVLVPGPKNGCSGSRPSSSLCIGSENAVPAVAEGESEVELVVACR